ncbi:MAG: carbohydrate ABC transporter permease [Anaerolinea sp.]|nr:carbohydrate ABC transporter permease [Anaerolinea sp.]MCC6972528.1 carbohydrate ABC transporter permease [Anaerolineae bacterium]CAG1007297.1 Inner membrane ABC transporter permease protein YcjP [Anaerolineae bacterium]
MDRAILSDIELRTTTGRLYYYGSMAVLLAIAVVVLFPFVYAFTSGLKGSTEIFTSGLQLLPQNPQWENYTTAWNKFEIAKLFFNSFVIVSVGVFLRLSISALAAYGLSRLKPMGGRYLMMLFFITLMIPGIAYLVPLFVTLKDVPILHISLLESYWGLWLPYAASAFAIFVLKNFFDRIPTEILDSARIDGASQLQILLRIVLPLSRSILLILAVLTFMDLWKDYLLPYLVITNPQYQPITVRLFYLADSNHGVNLQMAAAFIALMPPLMIAILLQRFMKTGVTMGSIKG